MKDVNKIKLDLLKIKIGSKVLDIGCSSGEQAIEIAKQGIIVYGIDSSVKRVKRFEKLAKQNNLQCFPIMADARKLPFKDDYFDAIIATEVFEHIPDISKVVDESFRVLKNGGWGCISVPTKLTEKIFRKIHPYYIKDSGHVNFFSKAEIISVLTKSGFTIEKIEKLNFEWTLFWLIHSIFKTRFDSTGSPIENYKISKGYHKMLSILQLFKMYNLLLWIGNNILPKSYYIYVKKEYS